MPKQRRYYQIDAKTAVLEALKRGKKRLLLVAAGGTGKTLTCVDIVKDMGRCCWCAHDENLLDQTALTLMIELDLLPAESIIQAFKSYKGIVNILKAYHSGKNITNEVKVIGGQIGIIKADQFIIDKPFVLASCQTLHNRLDRIPIDWFNTIVADEADLYLSRTFRAPLDYFQYDLLLGATATDYRMDGQPMEDLFEEKVYEYDLKQAIKDKFLCEIDTIVCKTTTNLDEVHTVGGDFNQKELTVKVNTLERNNKIVNKYLEHGEGRQFLAFAADIQHAIDLCEAFKEKGVNCNYVVSDKTLTTDRKGTIGQFKDKEIDGLVNVMILSVGFDHADTGCLIMGCPTKSKRKFMQQLFRGTRLKSLEFVKRWGQNLKVLDVIDVTRKHKLVNTHELEKELHPKDRIFISESNRAKLIEARERTTQMRDLQKDEHVNLFEIMSQPKIRDSERMKELASEAQLAVIVKLGYDIVNQQFTKAMCHDIIKDLPATSKQIYRLKKEGYNVDKFISFGDASYTISSIEKKKLQKTVSK